jgi:DNA-binding LytR/AlgR family response regulator
VRTAQGWQFCNLSMGDLQARLDPAQFHRVHRCFMVNLAAVETLEREGSRTQLLLRGEPRLVIPVSRSEVTGLRAALGIKAQRAAVKT